MTAVRDSSGTALASYSFDERSRRTGLTYANGASAAYSYDTASRLLSLDNQTGNGQHKYSYTYDNVGNRQDMMVTDSSGTRTHVYSYDDIYQLTAVDYPARLRLPGHGHHVPLRRRRQPQQRHRRQRHVHLYDQQPQPVHRRRHGQLPVRRSGNMVHDQNYAYGYDPENRLVTVRRTGSLPALTLGQALESPLTYTTGGSKAWSVLYTDGQGDFDCGYSDDPGASQSNWLQTTVTGPGTFRFWWKTSSSDTASAMAFLIDGTQQVSLVGDHHTWEQRSYTITGSGTHTLKWTFTRSSDQNHHGAAYVDSVQWTGSAVPAPEPAAELLAPADVHLRCQRPADRQDVRQRRLITSYVYDGDHCIGGV